MAKFDFENGGRLSGLIGPVVVAGEYVRSRPDRSKKHKSSPAQKVQQLRYKSTVNLYKKVKYKVVENIWKLKATKKYSAYNLFIKENLRAFGADGEIKDPTMLKMSIGDLPRPFNIEVSIDSVDSKRINISWENDLPDNIDRGRDHLVVLFYSEKRISMPIKTDFLRKEEFGTMELPDLFQRGSYIFIFFGDELNLAYTDSWVGKL